MVEKLTKRSNRNHLINFNSHLRTALTEHHSKEDYKHTETTMPASHVELGRDYLLKECEIHSDLIVEFCSGFHLKREKVATISAAGFTRSGSGFKSFLAGYALCVSQLSHFVCMIVLFTYCLSFAFLLTALCHLGTSRPCLTSSTL